MQLNIQDINSKIFEIRGMKVMLDSDLAKLYQVETKNLNKAVSRNLKRFPSDFMFQLTDEELKDLRFKFGTTNLSMRRTNPYLFTEQGMYSNVIISFKKGEELDSKIMDVLTQLIKKQDKQNTLKPSKTDGKIGFVK